MKKSTKFQPRENRALTANNRLSMPALCTYLMAISRYPALLGTRFMRVFCTAGPSLRLATD